jgi:hypothetical protein
VSSGLLAVDLVRRCLVLQEVLERTSERGSQTLAMELRAGLRIWRREQRMLENGRPDQIIAYIGRALVNEYKRFG